MREHAASLPECTPTMHPLLYHTALYLRTFDHDTSPTGERMQWVLVAISVNTVDDVHRKEWCAW
eukprot:349849-Chlamydomonas_euryale.AAC.3